MKLYLSSQEIGHDKDELMRLVGPNTKTAVIANAVDFRGKKNRYERVKKEIQSLAKLGLDPEELDLRDYFGKTESLQKKLKQYGLIWIRGGNVFILRRAMIQAGFDIAALDMIKDGSIVYGGYSAALVIIAPDLRGSEIVDDPHFIPEGYANIEPPRTGLGLIDYYIAAHYLNEQPWAKDVSRYIDFMEAEGCNVLKLMDGEVHIIETKKVLYNFEPSGV